MLHFRHFSNPVLLLPKYVLLGFFLSLFGCSDDFLNFPLFLCYFYVMLLLLTIFILLYFILCQHFLFLFLLSLIIFYMNFFAEEKENYQTFSFGQSRFIFMFGDNQRNTCHDKSIERNALDQRYTMFQKQHNERQQSSSYQSKRLKLNPRVCITSHIKKRDKYDKNEKVVHEKEQPDIRSKEKVQNIVKPISKLATLEKPLPTSVKKNPKIPSIQKKNNTEKGSSSSSTLKKKSAQVNKELNHGQIKQLVGNHLYQKQIDYLAQLRNSDSMKSSNFSSFRNTERSRPITTLTTDKSQKKERRLFGLLSDRAAIAEGVMNKSLFQVYEKVIRSSYNDQIYTDLEFPHNTQTPLPHTSWQHIPPTPSLILFPYSPPPLPPRSSAYPQPSFIQFMHILYTINPTYIERLLQPTIKNVFSVWLFYQRLFRPVIIDGYFLVDSKGQFVVGRGALWAAVFAKCVAKVVGGVGGLGGVTDQQIYHMLTARNLLTVPHDLFKASDLQISAYLRKQSLKKRIIIHKTKQKLQILTQLECKNLIFLHHHPKKCSSLLPPPLLYIIPSEPQQTYISQFTVFTDMITKLQLTCTQQCQIFFMAPPPPPKKKGKKSKIYLYKLDYDDQQKLGLLAQIDPTAAVGRGGGTGMGGIGGTGGTGRNFVKLGAGGYRIFYQDGKNLMKDIFSDGGGFQIDAKKGTYDVTVVGTSPIKLSSGEVLEKFNGRIEDSHSFYISS